MQMVVDLIVQGDTVIDVALLVTRGWIWVRSLWRVPLKKLRCVYYRLLIWLIAEPIKIFSNLYVKPNVKL